MAETARPEQIRDIITQTPYQLLQPKAALYDGIADYLKHVLDPLAADVSAVQQERQREQRSRKRKRGEVLDQEDILRLKSIHHKGYGPAQLWEQARRVIEAAKNEAQRGFNEAQERPAIANGDELSDTDDSVESQLGEEGVDYEVEGVDSGDEQYFSSDDDEEEEDGDIDMNGHDDFADVDMEDDITGEKDTFEDEEPTEEFVSDKFGLNDGFFSIDDFNRKSEFLEQQDARGDDDGAASDEDDVDWDADPLGQSNGKAEDDEDDEDEEDGPNFGDPDAESEDNDMEIGEGDLDGLDGMANTNSVMYADFFAPPASKKKRDKKGRPNPHNFPAKADTAQDDDVERTMAAVQRDLFEDEDSAGEDDDEAASDQDLDPTNPLSRRSAHERRKAALAAEIRKLEAANVAKREWTLSGEARAADRPVNSLLEQDLDFERTGKPVPVVTAELNESIEDLIKRRVLAHDFQDIIRRRPDDLATGPARRGRFDVALSDEKSKKGLAEEYEEEYQRRTDPNFVDARDEKTKKEEGEILAMWEKIRADLDGLSSWNFRPKTPKPTLEIRVDAPTITMEDARPNVGGEGGEVSQLAPQEVYKAGEGSKDVRGEVVGKSGLASSKEEMDREEKKRKKRREKERIRKANQNQGVQEGKKAKEKNNVVGDLKKGGVKIIGKKGEVKDIDGNTVKAGDTAGAGGGGRYKL